MEERKDGGEYGESVKERRTGTHELNLTHRYMNFFFPALFESEKKMEWETQLNSHAFTTLQDYYRSMRSFLLGRSRLTEDSDARVLAIAQINRPLNAIDNLVRQLDVAIRNPLRPGVGQLAVASDLAMRLGALRINACNTGCHRSQLSCSLSQAMTLARCHGLPPRLLRTAINTIRKDGSMVYVAKKNNVDVLNSSPKPPPRCVWVQFVCGCCAVCAYM